MDYKHLSEGDIPVYGTGGYMLNVDKALSYDKDAIGIGRKGTIDKPYVLKAPFWTVDTLFYCIPKEDYSLDFVYCIFQNVNWKEKDESTGVPSLSKVNINSTDVKVPTLAEQEKIGEYFSKLDSLITLHQRECFSFDFSGESAKTAQKTISWEQRKLGECFAERSERSADGELIAVTINSGVVKASDLNRHDNSSEDKSNYKVVRKNDIAYNSMRMWQGASGFSRYDGILSPAYTVLIPKEGVNSHFFAYMFKLYYMIHEFEINSQGLTKDTWNLKYPALSPISIFMPKYEEQTKIADYFEKLDTLITLHQHKPNKKGHDVLSVMPFKGNQRKPHYLCT